MPSWNDIIQEMQAAGQNLGIHIALTPPTEPPRTSSIKPNSASAKVKAASAKRQRRKKVAVGSYR